MFRLVETSAMGNNQSSLYRNGDRSEAVTIASFSEVSLTRFAGKNAGQVLQVWKDIENGKEVDHSDTVVRLALE